MRSILAATASVLLPLLCSCGGLPSGSTRPGSSDVAAARWSGAVPGPTAAGREPGAALGALRAHPAGGALGASRVSLLRAEGERLLPTLEGRARARAGRAEVTLGARASDPFRVAAGAGGLAVSVRLLGASDAEGRLDRGYVTYPDAAGPGGHLVHAVREEGTEDWLFFSEKPASEVARYELHLEQVAGLRLVAGTRTLELLDASGAPRLRVRAPWGIDRAGRRFEARLAVLDCALDESGRAPWGRPVTPPGAERCALEVDWGGQGLLYPVALDPSWSTTANLANARGGHVALLLLDGRVLVVGGQGPSAGTSAELFDAGGDGGAGSWAMTSPPLEARVGSQGSLLAGGAALVTGGQGLQYQGLATTERYDPKTGAWSPGPPMNSPHALHAQVTLADGRVLIAAGTSTQCNLSSSLAELFDPAAGADGAFAPLPSLGVPRYAQAAALLADGRVMIAGGYNTFTGQDSPAVEIFTPAKSGGAWSAGPDLPQAREFFTLTVLPSGKVLLVGGDDNIGLSFDTSTYLLDPAASGAAAWQPSGSLTTGRSGHSAWLLPSGRVVAALGVHKNSVLNSLEDMPTTEVFDPEASAGAWSAAAPLLLARSNASATTLPSGTVLVAGGLLQHQVAITDSELCAGGLCASGCVVDAVCPKGYFCDGGACTKPQASGAACTAAAQCVSGFCAQGVCCQTDCTGDCVSCNAADKSGAASGLCSPIAAGTDPYQQCPTSADPCGPDGMCGGVGVCRAFARAGTACGAVSCYQDALVQPTCQGGTCLVSAGQPQQYCQPFTCEGGACASACTVDGDCAKNYVCQGGGCKAPTGMPGCSDDAQCASGLCSQGVCCATRCDAPCATCSLAGKLGECTAAPALGLARGGSMFGGPCAGTCDGKSMTDVFYPDTNARCFSACKSGLNGQTSCTSPGCSGGLVTSTHCDGLGECVAEPPASCAPYVCDPPKATCRASCQHNVDCAPGSLCTQGQCEASSAGGGQGAGGSQPSGGAPSAGHAGAGASGRPAPFVGGAGGQGSGFAGSGGSSNADRPPASSGCGCRAAAPARSPAGGLLLAVAFGALARRASRARARDGSLA